MRKLHGSITWTEDAHGLFPSRELWPTHAPSKVMIFPTPAKQNSSLGSPYMDLFREFRSRIVREQSVLITAGYSFGDEHLNNIIYQALTIPTFRLIIFVDPAAGGYLAKLRVSRHLKPCRCWCAAKPPLESPVKCRQVLETPFVSDGRNLFPAASGNQIGAREVKSPFSHVGAKRSPHEQNTLCT